MNLREKNDDGGDDDLELRLSLQLKCSSQISPPNLPTKTLNGIAPESSSASRPNNLLAIDMNKLPEGGDTEPPSLSAVSSPDSTISSGSRKRNEREETSLEKHSASSEGGGDDDLSRKKLRLSKEQVAVLEEMFKLQSTLNLNQKVTLARQLNLQTRQVEVWFQNRRARTKLKRTEVDYHFLKRRCQDLTEENRRLEKEVAELRALKISPQVYMQMKPPTTLSMCPQCERMAVVPKLSLATSSTQPAATETSTSGHIIPVGPQDQKTQTVSTWLINRLHENFGPRS